jgi:hypothetical protein
MTVDKRTFILGVLSLSAVILVAANILAPHGAVADTAIYNEAYQLQTGRINGGGEALYVTENRTGNMAVFVYSPNTKKLEAMDSKPVMAAFGGGGVPTPARGAYGR